MFRIKRALMTKILNKRKKKDPFNYEQAEAFTVGKDGDGTINNSYYFSAHSAEKDESLYTRLGLRDNGVAEVWAVYIKGDKHYMLKQLYFTADDSPLKVENTEKGWAFYFDGVLTDENGTEIKAKMDCLFTSANRIIDFYSHMPSKRLATAMAQEKWTKEFFEDSQKNSQTHYEQEGVLTGTVTLDKETVEINLPCLRDHSFGRRIWGYMNNHLWLAGVDEKCMVNFSMVSYPGIGILEVGHLRRNSTDIDFVTKAHYDRNIIAKGSIPDGLTMELTINGKERITLDGKVLLADDYVFENGDYTLTEGIGEFLIDGVKCRGIFEIGFNKDANRYFKGKKIDKIKE